VLLEYNLNLTHIYVIFQRLSAFCYLPATLSIIWCCELLTFYHFLPSMIDNTTSCRWLWYNERGSNRQTKEDAIKVSFQHNLMPMAVGWECGQCSYPTMDLW